MGYFSSLMNISGIAFGQGNNDTGGQGAVDTALPQPIHREDITFVEPTGSHIDYVSENLETAVTSKDMENTNLEISTIKEIYNEGGDGGLKEIEGEEVQQGQNKQVMDNKGEGEGGKKQNPAIFKNKGNEANVGYEKVSNIVYEKVDNIVYENDKSMHQSDEYFCQNPKERVINPEIHENLVACKTDGKKNEKPYVNSSDEVANIDFSQGQSHNQEIHAETITYLSNKKGIDKLTEKSESKREIVLKEVEKRLVEPHRIPEANLITEKIISKAIPATQSPDSIMQENREFSLSIGTINVTIEEPQIEPKFPVQIPTANRQNRVGLGETLSTRLLRHYIRLRS